jgi:hypothetical protein
VKIKLGQWGEFEFDKADAEIVVPLVLLPLGLAFTPLNKAWLWGGGAAYYLLYFFLKPCAAGLKKTFWRGHHWWTFRCPYCHSREMVEQGLQEYHGDVPYYFHICNRCKSTSVLVNERLLKATRKAEIEIGS